MEYKSDSTPLTPDEQAEVAKLVDPLRALIDRYIEERPTLPFETILEALARLTNYYERLETHILTQIERHTAPKLNNKP